MGWIPYFDYCSNETFLHGVRIEIAYEWTIY